MKRILVFCLTIITSLNLFAQWKVTTREDDYTLEKFNIIEWVDRKQLIAAFYNPSEGNIRLAYYFSGLKYFDQTWDAMINNNGELESKNVYASIRVTNIDKTYKEFTDTYLMWFGSIDKAGDSFFGGIELDMDADLLKKGTYLTARIENPFIDNYITMKISLAGFTSAYNKAK